MADKKTSTTPGVKKTSKRAEIIRTLGAISIDDVRNEEEFKACFALHTMLVGIKKERKKRGSKAVPTPALATSGVDNM